MGERHHPTRYVQQAGVSIPVPDTSLIGETHIESRRSTGGKISINGVLDASKYEGFSSRNPTIFCELHVRH